MAENKRQHYVPKFILRNFSEDANIVYVYSLKHHKSFRSQIRDICQEKYFYTKEIEFEQNLGKIEGKQALILKKLIKDFSFYSLEEKERYYWFLFILMQHSRTKGSAKLCNKIFNVFYDERGKPLLKESSELKQKGITPEFIDSTTFILDNPQMYSIIMGMMEAELISDLFPIFLINNTDRPFVVSDDFICMYNYLKSKKYATVGLQAPGLQIYCPLNENIVFLLVDHEFYNIDFDKNRNGTGIIYVKKPNDIDAINKLQILNCDQNIIFSSQAYEKYVKELHFEVEQLLNKKYTEYNQVLHKIPTGYRLELSFIHLNSEMNKKWKKKSNK